MEVKFNLSHAKGLIREKIEAGKVVKDIEACIEYCKRFFFPCRKNQHMLVEGDEVTVYKKDEIKADYFDRLGKQMCDWYFKETDTIYTIVNEISKPRLYEDKINLFPGFMHADTVKPFDQYSSQIKNYVQEFLNYIKEVLAYNKQDHYEYLIKWTANMCQGKKNDSLLYFKSVEGTGKSFFFDTLIDYVLGPKICYKSNAEPLLTPYNKVLCGKVLVVFEELPTFSIGQWQKVAGELKEMVTGSMANYTNKYENVFRAENLNNYGINTNVKALTHSEGRRIYEADINTVHERDYEFYGDLAKKCHNKNVGEALFSYFLSINTSKFGGQKDMPETFNRRNAIAATLDSVHEFLKTKYIMKQEGIKKKDVGILYDEYVNFMTSKDKGPYSKFEFTAKMRELQCDYHKTNGKNKYDISYEKLKTIADKKKWIHELDEFEDDEIKVDEDPFGVEVIEKKETLKNIFPPVKPKFDVVKVYDDDDIYENINREIAIHKERSEVLTKSAKELMRKHYEMLEMLDENKYVGVGHESPENEDHDSENETEFDYELDLNEAIKAYFK